MIQSKLNIQHLNTLGLPCQADGLCHISSAQDLAAAYNDKRFSDKPKLILGGGSNVLLVSDFPGLVLQPEWRGIDIIDQDHQSVIIRVGASEPWYQLVLWSVQQGYYGLENLAAIPGWCGAAPIQNIGAYGAEFSDICLSVDTIDQHNFSSKTILANDCQFGYRSSIFKTAQTTDRTQNQLVTHITLRLTKHGELKLNYPGITDALQDINVKHPQPADVATAITHIRQHKLPDPNTLGNAGSFFKNPIVSTTQADALLAEYPQLPHWPNAQQVKLSAAWLIDQCGWKGHRQGAVGVHRHHALVLVHYGNGNGQQLLQLANAIQQDVQQRFNIQLQPEPKIINYSTP